MNTEKAEAMPLLWVSTCLLCLTLGYAAAIWTHDQDVDGMAMVVGIAITSVAISALAVSEAGRPDEEEDAS